MPPSWSSTSRTWASRRATCCAGRRATAPKRWAVGTSWAGSRRATSPTSSSSRATRAPTSGCSRTPRRSRPCCAVGSFPSISCRADSDRIRLHVPHRSAYRPFLGAASVLALGLFAAGCVSTPLQDRDWVAVQTEHYQVWSSLSRDESIRLAIDLEHFRTATAFISGHAIPADAVQTRVYAFDDRGIGRLFAHESQRAYLLTRQPGDVIVLRTGGGWEGDAWTPFKLEYARRILWNASPDVLPPWLDEGLPQLASTVESLEDGARAGSPPPHHLRDLRDNQWVSFDRLLGDTDLGAWSGLERGILAAESWALCHYLTFSGDPKVIPEDALTRYRSRIAAGGEPAAVARAEFGDLGKL